MIGIISLNQFSFPVKWLFNKNFEFSFYWLLIIILEIKFTSCISEARWMKRDNVFKGNKWVNFYY